MNNDFSFKNIFKKETKLASYIVICLTIVVFSTSYAMFLQVDSNSKNQIVQAGDLKFTYTDGSVITNQNSKCFEPMSAEEANLYAGECSYQFSVQNSGSLKASYTLKLRMNKDNEMNPSALRAILKKKIGDTLEVVSGPVNVEDLDDGLLLTDEINQKEISVYSVQIYVDEDKATAEDNNKRVSFQIEGSGVVHEDQPIFTIPPETAVETITKLAETDTTNMAYDETVDNNLRYIGANPNNYVSFNNEKWRIIGVMNNIDDGTGKKESRLKIIRDESLGDYAWNDNDTSDWTTSSLKKLLNEDYLGSGVNGESLSSEAQDMIGIANWNIGATNDYDTSEATTASMYYEVERGSYTGIERPTTWLGKVGLFYPSDYGYATSGGASTDRKQCLETTLYDWDVADECRNNSWLYKNNEYQSVLTTWEGSSTFTDGLWVGADGQVNTATLTNKHSASPVVYLKSNIQIVGGDGSEGNPYQLGL